MNDLSPVRRESWVPEMIGAQAPVEVGTSTARMITQVCASMVVMIVLTSRLGLAVGAKQVPIVLPVAVAHIAIIALLGRATLSLARSIATAAILGIVIFATALVHRHTSTMSVIYLALIYVPLVVNTTLDGAALEKIWRVFIGVASVAAVLGVVQIAVQVVAGGYFLDPMQLLPESIQLGGYQTTYPIMRGVIPTLKANGMVFVEPSAFSQFLALAILGELWLFRRWRVLLLLATGMTLSFSGTGLLMLAGGIALGARMRSIASFGAVVLAVGTILVLTGFGEAFTSRIDEVRRPGTSGYERFVSPFVALSLPWEDSLAAVAWGYGAGRVEDLDTEYAANYSPIPKVMLEYGLVGLVAFAALWISMFGRLAVQRPIVGAMLVMYFLAAGSLLQPYTVFSLWALTAGFLKRPDDAEAPPQDFELEPAQPA